MMTMDTWDLKACGRLKATSYGQEDYFSMCIGPGTPGGPSPLPNVLWQEERKEGNPTERNNITSIMLIILFNALKIVIGI